MVRFETLVHDNFHKIELLNGAEAETIEVVPGAWYGDEYYAGYTIIRVTANDIEDYRYTDSEGTFVVEEYEVCKDGILMPTIFKPVNQ